MNKEIIMNLQQMKTKLIEELKQYEGHIAFVISDDKDIIKYNSHFVFPSASTIKIPLLVEAFRQNEESCLDLEKKITFSNEDIVGGSGVLQSLSIKELSLKDLLALMITVSDNTATNLVVDALGFQKHKTDFKNIGLHSTCLQRIMMDFDSVLEGKDNLICADDLHTCLQIINEPTSILSIDSQKSMLTMLEKQQLKDKLPYYIDEEKFWIVNKTGELTGVEHDCGIITYGEHTVYAVILCSKLVHKSHGQSFIRKTGKLISDYLLIKN